MTGYEEPHWRQVQDVGHRPDPVPHHPGDPAPARWLLTHRTPR
jgi:hypothetical protein